jgi:hypothetical protein
MFTRLGNTGSDTFGVMDFNIQLSQTPVSFGTQIFGFRILWYVIHETTFRS